VELRHLRYFVAVAEELHFARAARKLQMAQPPLSQAIMRLEESLGVKLLDRSSRAVQLTAAGRALLPEARDILERAALAERLVQRIGSGELDRLRIGFVPMSAMLTLPRAIRAFRKSWPRVEVQLQERTSAAQVEALRSGALDLGILVREIVDTSGLQLRPIERYGYVAAVPSTWPLARRSTLRIADFAGSPLILFPQQLVANFFADFSSACRKSGFTPHVQQQVAQPYTMFTLVSQELGIGIVQDTARHLKIDGVTFPPIRDMPPALSHEVALAWVPRSVPEPLRQMIATIQKSAATPR
jgi:DNA-binding transcriptional LysR family regulator